MCAIPLLKGSQKPNSPLKHLNQLLSTVPLLVIPLRFSPVQ